MTELRKAALQCYLQEMIKEEGITAESRPSEFLRHFVEDLERLVKEREAKNG